MPQELYAHFLQVFLLQDGHIQLICFIPELGIICSTGRTSYKQALLPFLSRLTHLSILTSDPALSASEILLVNSVPPALRTRTPRKCRTTTQLPYNNVWG